MKQGTIILFDGSLATVVYHGLEGYGVRLGILTDGFDVPYDFIVKPPYKVVDMDHINACVNACDGLNPEGIKPLVEAVERQCNFVCKSLCEATCRPLPCRNCPVDETRLSLIRDIVNLKTWGKP